MKTIFVFFILMGSVLICQGQTAVPGGFVSGTWNLEGSPYRVNGSIMIPSDSVLTVQPGVTIQFLGHYKLLVLGRLLAEGTAANKITFTVDHSDAGWYGIRFDDTPEKNDTSKLIYCNILYGSARGSGNDAYGGGLMISNFSKIVVNHCSLKFNSATYGGGIAIIGSNPVISNNDISENSAEWGGGMTIDTCNPFIFNNLIKDNTADYGGGIRCVYSSPSIIENIVTNNHATAGGGGGILCNASSPLIHNNFIRQNEANAGGGIYCSNDQCNPLITSNTIQYNSASGYNGGGIYLDAGSSGKIIGNLISHNTALFGGGAIIMFANSSSPLIENNIIFRNSARSGGGIECFRDSNPEILGNLIVNNSGSIDGGGIEFYSFATLTNNTIGNNSAGQNGREIAITNGSSPTFRNCIIYSRPDTSEYRVESVFIRDEDADPNFIYCGIMGGVAGFELNGNFYTGTYLHNVDTDPLFAAPTNGFVDDSTDLSIVWSLLNTSPCLNTGDPEGQYPPLDLAGKSRVYGTRIDMGAFEFQGPAVVHNNYLNNAVKVYPNPFNAFTIIQLPEYSNNIGLIIFNQYGQTVRSVINLSDDQIKIPRGNLNPGTYFYELRKENQLISTGKLIIID